MTIHVLVIDDSPIERRRIGLLLQKGMPEALVTFAENGRVGYDTMSAITPDVVLSDMRLPEMNGIEFVKRVRADENYVPVILMTSFGSEKIAVEALLAGASSYVPKLELESELVPTLFNILALSNQRHHRRKVINTLTRVDFHYSIPNDMDLISPLVCHLLDQITTMKLLRGQDLTHVGVALREAMSNAIHHGNLELDSSIRQADENAYYRLADERRIKSPYKERQMIVEAILTREEVRFTISDDGPGFDVENALNDSAEINLDRIGGRGLLLMRSFMDNVTFNDKGNTVNMTKKCGERLGEQPATPAEIIDIDAVPDQSELLSTVPATTS
jgi:CheY-like chemotaxis protein